MGGAGRFRCGGGLVCDSPHWARRSCRGRSPPRLQRWLQLGVGRHKERLLQAVCGSCSLVHQRPVLGHLLRRQLRRRGGRMEWCGRKGGSRRQRRRAVRVGSGRRVCGGQWAAPCRRRRRRRFTPAWRAQQQCWGGRGAATVAKGGVPVSPRHGYGCHCSSVHPWQGWCGHGGLCRGGRGRCHGPLCDGLRESRGRDAAAGLLPGGGWTLRGYDAWQRLHALLCVEGSELPEPLEAGLGAGRGAFHAA